TSFERLKDALGSFPVLEANDPYTVECLVLVKSEINVIPSDIGPLHHARNMNLQPPFLELLKRHSIRTLENAENFVSHCLPRGSGQGMVAVRPRHVKGWATSALGQKQTCAVQTSMSALPPISACMLLAQSDIATFDVRSCSRSDHCRRKAASKAALHREETERLAVVRHPRMFP